MSQLHGKQLRNQSTSLNKLSGTGIVTFQSTAEITFGTSSVTYQKVPTNNFDVVNKAYVDSVVQGLDVKESVKVKIDSSVTISDSSTVVSAASSQTPSVTLTAGDRVLLNGQVGASPSVDNGIWLVGTGTASLTRPADFTGADTVTPGAFTFVEEGTFADSGFVLITDGSITIGTTPIKFVQFSSAGVIQAGTGLTKTGNVIDIEDTGVTASSYGSANTVVGFTVNAQGQLTSAGETSILIDSSQVSNFNTSVNNLVFNSAKFVDSDSVDFTVTGGTSVTADVRVDSNKGLTVSSNGLEIKAGTGLTFSGGDLVVDSSQFGIQGASNGLTVSNSNVELGGTLTNDTTIDGGGNGLLFTNLDNFNITASQSIYTSDNGQGITYADNYSSTFVARSLVDKGYVDNLVGTATASTTYTAGDGLDLTGLEFSVNTGLGLTISSDNVAMVWGGTSSGLTFSNNAVKANVDGTTIAINGSGQLSVIAGSAKPEYIEQGYNAPIVVPSSSINNFSRVQAFVNGLEVSIGVTGGGVGVANLPAANSTTEAFVYNGIEFTWTTFAGYDIDSSDIVRIVFEK